MRRQSVRSSSLSLSLSRSRFSSAVAATTLHAYLQIREHDHFLPRDLLRGHVRHESAQNSPRTLRFTEIDLLDVLRAREKTVAASGASCAAFPFAVVVVARRREDWRRDRVVFIVVARWTARAVSVDAATRMGSARESVTR